MTPNHDFSDTEKGERLAQEIIQLIKDEQLELKAENCPELMDHLNDPDVGKLVEGLLSSETLATAIQSFNHADKVSRRDELVEILNAAKIRQRRLKLMRRVSILTGIAASVLVAAILLFNTPTHHSQLQSLSYQAVSDSTDKPIIIFSTGERVELTDDMIDGLKSTTAHPEIAAHQTTYNTVVIPRMYDYALTLADGSHIQMNANSELKYSTTLLSDSIREVFLSGEAYFRVAKGTRPFVVNVNGIKIRVYGTEFNINTHKRGITETVLVEGSVSVTTIKQREIKLSPGQLLRYENSNGNHTVKNVDTFAYTAWRNGFLYCQESPLSELLENIAVWYGVTFEYDAGDLNSDEYILSVSLNRNHSLDTILNSIETITGLKFVKERSYVYRIER